MIKIKQACFLIGFLSIFFLVDSVCLAGDITAVHAGNGLSGGGTTGDVTLDVTAPLTLSTGSFKYNTITGIHTGKYAGVSGKNSNHENYGYLGGASYGVKGLNSRFHTAGRIASKYGVQGSYAFQTNGYNLGYLGSKKYGVRGNHKNGNYGYLGSSSRGVHGYSPSGTGGYFDSPSGYGLIVNRGNVGIGTKDPETKLVIRGDGTNWSEGFLSIKNLNEDAGIRIYNNDTDVKHHIFNVNDEGDMLRLAPTGNYASGGITIFQNGFVGIGTVSPDNELDVRGTIRAEELIIETGWADYVFKHDYVRMDLDQVENHIKSKGQLPGIPTEAEVKENGIAIGAFQVKLLEKIEELTLYLIEQDKKIQRQSNMISTQNQMLSSLKEEMDTLQQKVSSSPVSILQ